MSTGKILLAGVATGAVIGMILAPEKGSEIRKKISKTGEKYWDSIKETFSGFTDSVSHKFEAAKKEGAEMVEKGKDKVEHAAKEVAHAAKKVEKAAKV